MAPLRRKVSLETQLRSEPSRAAKTRSDCCDMKRVGCWQARLHTEKRTLYYLHRLNLAVPIGAGDFITTNLGAQ